MDYYYRANGRHAENSSYHWDSSEEVDCDREEATEEDHEPVQLHAHANDGPAKQDDEDATEECPATLGLVPLEEESEGSLQTNNTGQTRQE